MTRGEALKDFFRKTILPVASAVLLYCIFRSACVKKRGAGLSLASGSSAGCRLGSGGCGSGSYTGGGSLGGGIALFLLNFVLSALSAAASLSGGCWWRRGMCR